MSNTVGALARIKQHIALVDIVDFTANYSQ